MLVRCSRCSWCSHFSQSLQASLLPSCQGMDGLLPPQSATRWIRCRSGADPVWIRCCPCAVSAASTVTLSGLSRLLLVLCWSLALWYSTTWSRSSLGQILVQIRCRSFVDPVHPVQPVQSSPLELARLPSFLLESRLGLLPPLSLPPGGSGADPVQIRC